MLAFSIPSYTEEEFLLLSQFSYLTFPSYAHSQNPPFYIREKTLGQIALQLLAYKKTTPNIPKEFTCQETRTLLISILQHPRLQHLVLYRYNNDNRDSIHNPYGTGFVGTAFYAPTSDEYIYVFTGSEGKKNAQSEGVSSPYLTVDWLDNYTYFTTCQSPQFHKTIQFIATSFPTHYHRIYTSGHSKGGANALYAAANFQSITAIAFNSPGISQCLSKEQKILLSHSHSINYITQGDLVGPLLFHRERTRYVKISPFTPSNPLAQHASSAFYFDSNGHVSTGTRTKLSFMVENISKYLYVSNQLSGAPITKFYTDLKDLL